jgi:hypothetical protein
VAKKLAPVFPCDIALVPMNIRRFLFRHLKGLREPLGLGCLIQISQEFREEIIRAYDLHVKQDIMDITIGFTCA